MPISIRLIKFIFIFLITSIAVESVSSLGNKTYTKYCQS